MRYCHSRRQTWTWTVVCSCLSMWAASQSWGFDEPTPPVGLVGLLPTTAPDGLTEQDFNELVESIDDSWKDWTRQTAEVVKSFYEGSHPTVEDQRRALDQVKVKLKTVEKALADPRYLSIYPQLTKLFYRLGAEVELADVILTTLTQGPDQARQQRLKPAFEQLGTAVSGVETDLKQFNHAGPWRTFANLPGLTGLNADSPNALSVVAGVKARFEARESYAPEAREFLSRESFLKLEDALTAVLKASNETGTFDVAGLREAYAQLIDQLNQYRSEPGIELEAAIRQSIDTLRAKSPDGGATVADLLGRQLLNYNLRVYASEGLLNRLIRETRVEQSPVRERLQEATVYGNQVTQVTSSIDLIPNPLVASFHLMLNGSIRSNANAYADRATIHTVGNHAFTASKQVTFDGQEFSLAPALVSAYANNQAVGANTHMGRMPIFGRIANNIAMREATARAPQSNGYTIQKIQQQVGPQFDQQASEQLGNASKQLQTKTYGPLRKYDLYPDAMLWSTTATELRVSTRLMGTQELGGSVSAPVGRIPANGLVTQIHESLLSHSFDRLGLKGKAMSEDQVRELLESRLSEILNREVKIPKPETAAGDAEQKANILVFDEKDPVRFTIQNGIVTIIIRAGLQREGMEDIPTQIISVPFTPSLSEGKIVLARGNVGVKPVTRPPNVAAQVARAQVMRQKIQSALPERTIDGTLHLKIENKSLDLSVTDLSAEAGWLTIGLK